MAGPGGEQSQSSGLDGKSNEKAVKHPESRSLAERSANAFRTELGSAQSAAARIQYCHGSLSIEEFRKILEDPELNIVGVNPGPRELAQSEVITYKRLPQVPPAPPYDGEMMTEIPIIRAALQKAGINPDNLNGIKIAAIDSHTGAKDENNHGANVMGVIQDNHHGLIHGAGVIPIERQEGGISYPDYANKPDGLGQAVSDCACGILNRTTSKLREQCLDKRDPALRVVNISMSGSNTYLYEDIFNSMLQDPEKYRPWIVQLLGEEKANEWIASVKNNPEPNAQTDALDKPLWQAIANFVDSKLAQDPKFKAAQAEYQRTTEQIAKQGIVLVVAAGNAQNDLQRHNLNLKPGAGFNWLAQSNHVIAVGACDLNRTPGDHSDDKVPKFTSHGDGQFQPTVVAQGTMVPSRWQGIDGTSFASPLVSATVGLMLAQNPNLTFDDVKRMLQQNSTKLQGAGPEAQGAGELNIDQAVIAAAKTVKT